ncbi:MAG: hypothetical protein L3K18_03745 [Thermoplasmata archaeon]|nr:hypothetical protein [Thermoplasmata archaeon]
MTPAGADAGSSAREAREAAPAARESEPDRDSAFRQLEANERDLHSALLGILAFVVVYASLAMLEWIAWAWGTGLYALQSELPFLVFFELAIVCLVVAGLSMSHRRRLELEHIRRQLLHGQEGGRGFHSPLAHAEMNAGVLRGLSRQVDSLLLWLPFAIVMTVWIGLILLGNLLARATNSTPLDRTLGLAIILIGVPLAVAIFGVGVLLAIRNSTRRQVRLSRVSLEWWNAEPPTPGTGPATQGSEVPGGSTHLIPIHPSFAVARLRRRRSEERRAVLVTAGGALLAMAALAGVAAGLSSYIAGPRDCCWGLYAPFTGVVFGILLAGFLPPAYVGILVLRRASDPRSTGGGRDEVGLAGNRISDTIAWFVQAETLRGGLREDARDALWLAWFATAWSIGGLFLLWTFGIQPVRIFPEGVPGLETGPLAALVIGESVVALVPLALAAFATALWMRRRRDDLASEDESRSVLQAYAALEQGFWERF